MAYYGQGVDPLTGLPYTGVGVGVGYVDPALGGLGGGVYQDPLLGGVGVGGGVGYTTVTSDGFGGTNVTQTQIGYDPYTGASVTTTTTENTGFGAGGYGGY